MRRALSLLAWAVIAVALIGGLLPVGRIFTAPVAHADPPPPPRAEQAGPRAYTLAFTGTAVDFNLGGMEPDFDPLYRVTVNGSLHDLRAASQALPNARLVLSAYMEVFQPDTTPILPDLIHPNRTAGDMAGFLSGKAALVNAGGHVVYRGSLLAEIFADNTEHLLVDLYPSGAAPTAAAIRLQGVVSLEKGGAEHGSLHALRPLSRAALAVPPGRQPSWQSVIAGLGVRVPAMVGTAGSGQQSSTAPAPPAALQSAAPRSSMLQNRALPVVFAGIALLAALLALLAWRGRKPAAVAPDALPQERDPAAAAGEAHES